jgi:hypothetical protein
MESQGTSGERHHYLILIAQTTVPYHRLLVALLERDAYNYIGSGEKKSVGDQSTNARGTSLGKEKKRKEKAASLEGFESIGHKD